MNCIVVDDEGCRHDLFEKYLTQAGHTVLHAFDAKEGLEIIQSCPETIALLLLDHDMPPGNTGSWLATEILSLSKEKYPAMMFTQSINPDGAANIMAKFRSAGVYVEHRPFSEEMVKKLVRDLETQ
jgi:DNA-binding response OmpR family regulator